MSKIHQIYRFKKLERTDVNPRTASDINLLAPQLFSHHVEPISEESLLRALEREQVILIVLHGSSIIGMGRICRLPFFFGKTDCEIHDVIVDADHRDKGVGAEIVKELLHIARGHYHADRVSLTSRPEREKANSLYQGFGFELVETNLYRKEIDYTDGR